MGVRDTRGCEGRRVRVEGRGVVVVCVVFVVADSLDGWSSLPAGEIPKSKNRRVSVAP
jgi:hypothetical protein